MNKNFLSEKKHLPIIFVALLFAVAGSLLLTLTSAGPSDPNDPDYPLADTNNDYKVDIFDLSYVLSKWTTNDSTADFNNDGIVNVFDLSYLLAQWGRVDTPTNSSGFSFAAAGDFGSSYEAGLVFDSVGAGDTDFMLALGDLGYKGGGESAWCNFVNSRVGNSYPVQIVAGNHDDGPSTGDGDIAKYVQCLPDRIGGITGNYGTEYYFDYNGLARFIMISPDINNYGADYWNGNTHYNWLSSAIDGANNAGIEWVVVGMHKNCITAGQKSCEIGEDLMNLLVEKRVDLILQGHEHAYYRSNQLALSSSCTALRDGQFNNNCVVDTDDNFQKNAGSVLTISGSGGRGLRSRDSRNSTESAYFAAKLDSNSGNGGVGQGYLDVQVSSSSMTANYVEVTGSSNFEDNFNISY